MSQIASFDVFDTVLTRAVGSPEAVFLFLGRTLAQQGLISCSPEAFARARIDAEGHAHQNLGPSCTLDDIHKELAIALGLNESQSQSFMQAEYALEAKLIRAIPNAAERLAHARSLGQRVVFLSDMYLPSEFIRLQLVQHGLWEEGDRIYCSCERGKSKQSGELFLDLLENEKVPPQSVVHQGNSPQGDTLPAARLGMRVNPFVEANPNRYENILEAHGWETEGLASAMAGASRLARLGTSASDAREAALRTVAAGVLAPTLTAYVLWLLARARQLGLQRLYFLSRDGQVLMEIARNLVKTLNIDCEIRYLYGSRQSWNLPAVINGSDEELAWIWDSPDLLSVNSLMARIGLEAEQVERQLQSAGLVREDWSRPLQPAELHALQQSLLTPEARSLVVNQAYQRRQVLLHYLEQEGAFDGRSWGLVDLGWYGSMQNALSAVLLESGGSPPVGFYFALLKGKIAHKFEAYRETYYFDQHLGLGYLDAVPDLIALMEMFCVSDHGTVIDFAEKDGRVAPVLKEDRNHKVIDWGLPLVRETLFHFQDNFLLDESLLNPWADLREAVTWLLRAFWLQPSSDEAKAWADFPWEDGLGSETYWMPLAKAFRWKDVLRAVTRASVAPHHRASWMKGSLVLSPPAVRLALLSLAGFFHTFRSLRWRAMAWLRAWKNRFLS